MPYIEKELSLVDESSQSGVAEILDSPNCNIGVCFSWDAISQLRIIQKKRVLNRLVKIS